MSRHIIVYSHGFGVEKDDRGLLTAIAAAMPEAEHVLFDYNVVNVAARTLTVAPIPQQVAKLQRVVAEVRHQNPDAAIDIVAHSQGCVVAATAKPEGIRRAVLLAPPVNLNAERLIKLFEGRAGTEINRDGVSRLTRNDGTTTIVPAAYWASLEGPPAISLYNAWSQTTEIVIIKAEHDEVLGTVVYDGIDPRIKLESMEASHNFSNAARPVVVELVKQRLS